MIENRWLRGGVALVAGFTLTIAVIQVAQRSSSTSDRPGERLGELSMMEYCRAAYGPRASAVHLQPGAFGWRCWSQRNQLLDPSDINPDDACELLFGTPAFAKSKDYAAAYSWACYRGPAEG